jgi:hypothetical protein
MPKGRRWRASRYSRSNRSSATESENWQANSPATPLHIGGVRVGAMRPGRYLADLPVRSITVISMDNSALHSSRVAAKLSVSAGPISRASIRSDVRRNPLPISILAMDSARNQCRRRSCIRGTMARQPQRQRETLLPHAGTVRARAERMPFQPPAQTGLPGVESAGRCSSSPLVSQPVPAFRINVRRQDWLLTATKRRLPPRRPAPASLSWQRLLRADSLRRGCLLRLPRSLDRRPTPPGCLDDSLPASGAELPFRLCGFPRG